MKIRAYLDNNATTRLAPEALAAMLPYFTELYLNPSSAAGDFLGASTPIADAKGSLAQLFDAPDLADGFILTSGASEANSWAVHAAIAGRPAGHIVASAIEHPSVLAALASARAAGWCVDLAPPNAEGLVSAESVANLLTPRTALVSVMLANNETGVVQPIGAIGERLREFCPQALFHVDATQAVGRIALSLYGELSLADFVSLSAHKFHGPKGIGAIFAADTARLSPMIYGNQEGGRRGGTPDAAAAAGVAVAAKLARERLGAMAQVAQLRDRFEEALTERFPKVQILGATVERLPNTSYFLLPGVGGDDAVEALAQSGVVVAAGSACSSGSSTPSHVVTAMGVEYEVAKTAVRVSLSHETVWEDLALVIERLGDLHAG